MAVADATDRIDLETWDRCHESWEQIASRLWFSLATLRTFSEPARLVGLVRLLTAL